MPQLEELAAAIARDSYDSFVAAEAIPLDPLLTAGLQSDPVLIRTLRPALVPVDRHSRFAEAVKTMSADPELNVIAPREGELDPMFLQSSGGERHSLDALLSRLIQMAFTELYLKNLPRDRDTFVAAVLANLKQFREGVRGAPMSSRTAIGLTGARLPDGAVIQTPWGDLHNTAQEAGIDRFRLGGPAMTSMFLYMSHREKLVIDRNPQPPPYKTDQNISARRERAVMLLPLAFALAHRPGLRVVPRLTVYVHLSPLDASMSYPWPPAGPTVGFTPTINADRLDDIAPVVGVVGRPSLI